MCGKRFVSLVQAGVEPVGKGASSEDDLADIGGLVIRVEKGKVLEAFFDIYKYEDTPEVYL